MSKTHGGTDRDSPPSTPRWVKAFGIVAFVLVLLVVAMMLIGSGDHGPGRHMPSGGAGSHIASAATEHRLQQP